VKGSRREVAEASAREFAETAPPGWSLTHLGDVAELQPGYAFDSDWFVAAGVRLLRGTNIVPGSTRWDDVVCLPLERVDQFDSFRLAAGDIVIAMDRPFISTGLKVARLAASDCPALLVQRVGRFRPTAAISTDYLHYYLNGSTFGMHVGGLATGTQLPHISKTDIETCPILVPPANEQHRIVAKLDAIFEQTRAAKARLERLPALLEKLKYSILAAAFRGDLTADWRAANSDVEPASTLLDRMRTERRRRWEAALRAKGKDPTKWTCEETDTINADELPELPESWTWTTAGELVQRIEAGRSPKAHGRPASLDEQGVLKVSAVSWGRFLPGENKALVGGDVAEPELLVRRGDLLISRANTVELVGAVVIVDGDYANLMLSDKTLRLVVTDAVTREFLLHALCTAPVRRVFEEDATGTSDSMRNLSQGKIRAAPIPLAPLAEQIAIGHRLQGSLAALNALEERCRTATARCVGLEQAALAQAFRGELVPQDPNDEPAVVLLDCVRAARADAPENARRGHHLADAPTSGGKANGHNTASSDDSLDLVVAALQQGEPRLTAANIAEATNLDGPTVRQVLKTLVAAGQVLVHGKARGISYEWIA
jgi:type I restriction enzyme S subunit